jgi:hypothetical protein
VASDRPLSCNPVMATKRIEQAMSFIEHEWEFACRKRARRLWIDIGSHRMARAFSAHIASYPAAAR